MRKNNERQINDNCKGSYQISCFDKLNSAKGSDSRVGEKAKIGRVTKREEDRELGFERSSVGCYVDEKVLSLCAEDDKGIEGRWHFFGSKRKRSD